MKYFLYIIIPLAILFKFKYSVDQMRILNRSFEKRIEKMQDNITTLKAEWTFFTKPNHITRLAREHLNMQYIESSQIHARK